MSSGGIGDDDVEGTVKHIKHYQVYRGMSPTTSTRLEVGLRVALYSEDRRHSSFLIRRIDSQRIILKD